MSLEGFISISARQFSLPARSGVVWQDWGTCRADSDVVQINVRNEHISDVLALLVYWKLVLYIFRMCLGCLSRPPFLWKHREELQHLISVRAPLLSVSLLVVIVWLPLSNQFWAEPSASLLCTAVGAQRILQ